MGKLHSELNETMQEFIKQQKIFFVGTAARDGRVNISPKGMDTLRILDSNSVLWLNLTGSTNETAAHLLDSDRMTIMFCSFDGEPMILRLYGFASVIHPRDESWNGLIRQFSAFPGARQIFEMDIDLVQTSCGMGVPYFDYISERDQLVEWARKKGDEGLKKYWYENNRTSIDGKPTEIFSS